MEYEDKVRWLRRYREAEREENELNEELDQLRAKAEKVTPRLTGMPAGGGGGGNTIPLAVEKIIEAQERLEKQIEESQSIRKEVEELVETVRNTRAKEILRRRYLQGQRWEEIACAMYIDYRWVTRLHHRIVEALEMPE